MSVVVENISKIYGAQKALDSISFRVNAGDILGFLGPNGAGKSTTMKILTGYLPASSGKAWVCNQAINENSVAVRRHIGYLPELNPLYSEMFVKEYLLFIADTYGMGKQATRATENMIEKTGLGPERKKKISRLSKGYKQRVGLAAAMIHDPEVLILDEPTSGLDPNQVGEIRKLIRESGKDKTVILSTHIMQEVEAMCNRVVIINKGKIVADDKPAALQQLVTTEYIVTVQFKNQPSTEELQQKLNCKSIEQCENTLIVYSDKDIREELALLASQNNWLILSMNLKEHSLENVFQTLTK